MKESSDLEPEVTKNFKCLAPGVGQVIDNDNEWFTMDISNEPRLDRLNHEEEFPTCLEKNLSITFFSAIDKPSINVF